MVNGGDCHGSAPFYLICQKKPTLMWWCLHISFFIGGVATLRSTITRLIPENTLVCTQFDVA